MHCKEQVYTAVHTVNKVVYRTELKRTD